MLIGQFSQLSNISVDTLRYYDQIGLLVPERKGNRRNYNQSDLKRLEIIKHLKDMNFSLDEIKYILQLDRQIDEGLEDDNLDRDSVLETRGIIQDKYQEILEMEKNIQKVKEQLEHILTKIDSTL